MPVRRTSFMALTVLLTVLLTPQLASATSLQNPTATAPVLGWTDQFGGDVPIGTNSVEDVIRDSTGDVYASGYVQGALPGQTAAGMYDAFVSKYSPSGALLWTSQFGTPGNDTVSHLALDSAGNVYAGGEAGGESLLDALPGESAAGGQDIFVRKYSSAGAVLLTQQFGTANTDYSGGLAVDPSGQVYFAGSTYGLFPGAGNTQSGFSDIFVRKMDSGLAPVWTTQFGSTSTDMVNDATLAPNVGYVAGDLYLAGETWGALPTSLGGASNPYSDSADMYVARISPSGSFSVTEWGTTSVDNAKGLAFNSAGDMFVAGYTNGNLTGTPHGDFDGVLIKWLGADGSFAGWLQYGTASLELAHSLALDGSGNPYVAGMSATSHAMVTKFNSALTQLWSRQFGTSATDAANGVAVAAADSVYAGGSTTGAFSGATMSGTTDGFLSKLDPDGVAPSASFNPAPPAFSTAISKTATFKVSWKGSDPLPSSGIAGYDLQYKSGASGTVRNKPRTTSKSINFTGVPGSTYYLRVRAADSAGNASPYSAYKSTVVPHNESAAKYSTGWNSANSSYCYLGNFKYTNKARSYLTFKFAGSSLGLVVTKGPKKGKAKIYVDGAYKKTIDTYSSSTLYRQVIPIGSYSNSSTTHSLKIVNVGTSGRPRLDIDGIAVKR